jgi:hypothetical protein
MKKIKNILVASILTLSAFTATIMTSCNPDACKDVICSNGGTCNDGSCSCPSGYEGPSCETLSSTKFLNSSSANSTWLTGANADGCYAAGYTMTISQSGTPKNLLIGNFAGFGSTASITVSVSGTKFTQVGTTTAGAVTISNVSGTIDTTLNPDKITFGYTAASTGIPAINCSSSALKQ